MLRLHAAARSVVVIATRANVFGTRSCKACNKRRSGRATEANRLRSARHPDAILASIKRKSLARRLADTTVQQAGLSVVLEAAAPTAKSPVADP